VCNEIPVSIDRERRVGIMRLQHALHGGMGRLHRRVGQRPLNRRIASSMGQRETTSFIGNPGYKIVRNLHGFADH